MGERSSNAAVEGGYHAGIPGEEEASEERRWEMRGREVLLAPTAKGAGKG